MDDFSIRPGPVFPIQDEHGRGSAYSAAQRRRRRQNQISTDVSDGETDPQPNDDDTPNFDETV